MTTINEVYIKNVNQIGNNYTDLFCLRAMGILSEGIRDDDERDTVQEFILSRVRIVGSKGITDNPETLDTTPPDNDEAV